MSDRRLACDGSGVETILVNSFLSFEILNVELGHLLLMPDFTKPPLHVKHLHLFLHFIPHLNEGVRVELGERLTVELVEHDVEAPFFGLFRVPFLEIIQVEDAVVVLPQGADTMA